MAPLPLDVTFTPAELAAAAVSLHAETIAVMIDVFRASTTITTALAAGVERIEVVETVQEGLARRAASGGSIFLGGERQGERPDGFDFGNSPLEYQDAALDGARLIFTTTNGTRALHALQGVAEVLICGFVNLAAVSRCVAEQGAPIHLACAGSHDRFCLEDALCAGALIDRLRRHGARFELSESAQAAYQLFSDHRPSLRSALLGSAWARYLRPRHAEDLDICTSIDAVDLVPCLRPPSSLTIRPRP